MSLGMIVNSGRILTAKLLLGESIDGITHCAIGDGDETFTDPLNPPSPDINQTTLRNERARKRFHKKTFLQEDEDGLIVIDGVHYSETANETNTIGIFFRFAENEANGITIKEYGFFGGNVSYVDGVQSDYAQTWHFRCGNQSCRQVLNPGYLYEVKHIPDFHKTSDTRLELVAVIRI